MRVVLLAAALWATLASASAADQPQAPAAEADKAPATQADKAPEPAPADAPRAREEAAPGPTAVDAPRADEHPKFGAMLDVGVPDGAGLSFVYRPFTWLRANAGLSYNLFGFGVRGGITLAPFYFAITPTLTVEGGSFFESDASSLAKQALPDTDLSQANDALKHLSYQYASGQVGVEIGSARNFVFFLRVGVSYLHSTVNLEKVLQSAVGDDTITAAPLKANATFPSAKLGLALYF